MMRLLLLTILCNLFIECFGQSNKKFSIYTGKVEGLSKEFFIKSVDEYEILRDSILGLAPITESKCPIEIRLYETVSGNDIRACTILMYDTVFRVNRIVKLIGGWDNNHRIKELNPIENIKAQESFAVFVKNGIFSLPEYASIDTASSVLTESGFVKDNRLCGVTDGVSFCIVYKCGDYYKRIYFSNMDEAQLNCYPDNIVIQRMKKITKQFEANIRLVKK